MTIAPATKPQATHQARASRALCLSRHRVFKSQSFQSQIKRDFEIREKQAMRFLILALSVMGILVSADAAKADRRVAFVVGNGAYKHVTALPNPPIDAKSMAGVLRNAGFDVVEGINLTRDEMTGRLLEFGKKTQGADVAVFYYAAVSYTHLRAHETDSYL